MNDCDSDRPNILLIITDQQSGEALSLGDADAPLQTPNLDALCASGLRFDRAYCATPICVPSRTSMFTGTYPHVNGILSNGKDETLSPEAPCAAIGLRDAGYDTAYFGKWHIPIDLHDPAVSGFDHVANVMHNGADIRLVDHALPWLAQERDRPFFAVASFNNPHNICEWARGKRGLDLPDGSLPEPPSAEACPPLRANHEPPEDETEALSILRRAYQASPTFPVGDFSDDDWRRYQFAYHRMVELIDQHVGRLLDGLDKMGLRENTVVVFCSDHGDCQGAHRWNQKTTFHEESARVPFVISQPGTIAPRVSQTFVQTGIDLMPTIFAQAGLAKSAHFPGVDLLTAPPREYIVSETFFRQGAAVDAIRPEIRGRMVRTDRFKYCVYEYGSHRESLVDLENDPGEMVNLARNPAYAELLAACRKQLAAWAKDHCDRFPVT